MKIQLIQTTQPQQNNLKPRQEEIVQQLLTFRYLTTIQIQTLLHHQYKDKIIKWLNDLTDKKYIYRFYTTQLRNEPAKYTTISGLWF